MPPHTLVFPFESVKEEGEYWCEVSVRYGARVFLHFILAQLKCQTVKTIPMFLFHQMRDSVIFVRLTE